MGPGRPPRSCAALVPRLRTEADINQPTILAEIVENDPQGDMVALVDDIERYPTICALLIGYWLPMRP